MMQITWPIGRHTNSVADYEFGSQNMNDNNKPTKR